MVDTTCRFDYNAFARVFKDSGDRSAIMDVIEFFMKELGIDGVAENINFKPYHHNKKRTVTGQCWEAKNSRKVFYVEFIGKSRDGKRNLAAVITTIAHEMIHIKQFLFNDLGKALCEKHDLSYRDTWWEREAWEGQEHLVRKFIDAISK